MNKDDLSDKAIAFAHENAMFLPGGTVLAAVSGGADSMALLHFLLCHQAALSLSRVEAAHINHGLRGPEAQRDEEFVRRCCDEWNVPVHVLSVDVKRESKRGEGLEEAGRRIRYAYLASVASDMPHCRIATAHTLNDQAETVLFHLARGCGPEGLCGIPPVRGDIVRPILCCTRREIEDYCADNRIAYVTDSSNRELSYTRNRIRLCVMPQLAAVHERPERAIGRMADILRQENEYMRMQATDALVQARCTANENAWNVQVLLSLHPALRRRALAMAATEAGCPQLESGHLFMLEKLLTTQGSGNLPADYHAIVKNGILLITTPHADTAAESLCESILQPDSRYVFGEKRYMCSLVDAEKLKNKKIYKKVLKYAFSYDMINHNVMVRFRRAGDRYHPAGRKCGKSLKKLFSEAGIPSSERNMIPVLADDEGILLVPGFGCDERVRINENTKTILIFSDALTDGDLADVRETVYSAGDHTGERMGQGGNA